MSTQLSNGPGWRVVSARVRTADHELIVKAGKQHRKGTVNAWASEVLMHAVHHSECLPPRRQQQLINTIKELLRLHDEWLESRGQAGQYITPSVRQSLDEALEGF